MERLEDFLQRNAELYPHKAAVLCGQSLTTYQELWQMSLERKRQLEEEGVGKGRIVFFRASQDTAFLATYFGIHLAGAVAAPLEEDIPADRFQALQADYGQTVLEDDVADVLFTTGTTGKSKGVIISHGTIVAEAENLTESQGFTHDTHFVICGPLNHIGSLSKIFPVMLNGATLHITDGMKDIEAIFRAFDHPTGRVVGTFLVPASIRMLLQFGKARLESLRDKMDFIETGAAAIGQGDMQTLCQVLPKTRLFNTYASTETGIISTYNFNDGACEVGCLGKHMKHSRFHITDEGFVACTGKTLMRGYLGDDALTRQVLRDDTVYTSDHGYIDEHGMLHLQCRAGDIINVGGYKVNPIEVEGAAMTFPGTRDCICIAHEHPVLGTMLKLLVVHEDERAFSHKAMALHISGMLERYKVPQQYELVEQVARTYNGKLNRKFYVTP